MSRNRILIGALALALPFVSQASGSLNGDYYILSSNNPDVEHGIDGGTVTGLVQSHLGPDGLPVVNGTYSGPSGPITDVNGAGELLWWSTGVNAFSTQDLGIGVNGKRTDALPLNMNVYPGGSNFDGSDGYSAVHWSGTFDAGLGGGSIGMTLGADDDAWVFIDGVLADDDGGVKGFTSVPFTTSPLSPGMHNIDIFFADRHTTGSEIYFDGQVNFNATPEPFTMALGLSGIGMFLKRRKRQTSAN